MPAVQEGEGLQLVLRDLLQQAQWRQLDSELQLLCHMAMNLVQLLVHMRRLMAVLVDPPEQVQVGKHNLGSPDPLVFGLLVTEREEGISAGMVLGIAVQVVPAGMEHEGTSALPPAGKQLQVGMEAGLVVDPVPMAAVLEGRSLYHSVAVHSVWQLLVLEVWLEHQEPVVVPLHGPHDQPWS